MDHPDLRAACHILASAAVILGAEESQLLDDPAVVAVAKALGIGEPDSSDLEVVLHLRLVLEAAVGSMGDHDLAHAARLVTGLHVDTRGRQRRFRRPAAARALDVSEGHFNRRAEKRIIDQLTVNLYRLLVFEQRWPDSSRPAPFTYPSDDG